MASLKTLTESIDLYVSHGAPPGGFLTAVICNDLRAACERADDTSRLIIWDVVNYLYNDCPGTCWGSKKAHETWMADHAKRRLDESERKD